MALALVRGTVHFLQSANGVVIALAVVAPFWWYFENQLQQLRERVL